MFDGNRLKRNAPKPLVSIIIPTFNSMTGTKNIDKTLESLMRQKYQNTEVLVIDNFSTDNTYEVCKVQPIRFFRLRGTRSEARNYGISKMLGDYAFFVDSDHILTPKVVEDCVNETVNFGADCILVPVKFVNEKKCFLDCSQMRNLEYKLGLGILTFFLFYSKNIIQDVKYHENVELFEDAIFFSEILKKKPKVSHIRSFIYHIEDGTVKNLILRSWNYGKKLRFTKAEIGLSDSLKYIQDLSAVNARILNRLCKTILNESNDLTIFFLFLLYILLKYLSFGISYCFSLLEKS